MLESTRSVGFDAFAEHLADPATRAYLDDAQCKVFLIQKVMDDILEFQVPFCEDHFAEGLANLCEGRFDEGLEFSLARSQPCDAQSDGRFGYRDTNAGNSISGDQIGDHLFDVALAEPEEFYRMKKAALMPESELLDQARFDGLTEHLNHLCRDSRQSE